MYANGITGILLPAAVVKGRTGANGTMSPFLDIDSAIALLFCAAELGHVQLLAVMTWAADRAASVAAARAHRAHTEAPIMVAMAIRSAVQLLRTERNQGMNRM